MNLLTPVVSKFQLTAGVVQEIYSCPAGKTHSIVDLTFFKDNLSIDSVVAIALSSESNPANLTTVDYFIDDIELIGLVNSGELNKVMVGTGERLYAVVLGGADVVIRLSGVEENNPKVLKAGRLGASNITGTSQTQVFHNNTPLTAYTSCSVTLFNTSPDNNSEVSAWISSSATPSASDKVMKISIPFQDTTIIENMMLMPGERIIIQSTQANMEFFINGVVVSQ